MKILLKISILVIFMTTSSYAGLVNAISVIINDEPITLYEVYNYAHKFKISTKQSLDLLIRQKLEDAQIAKLHIKVSDFEIDEYIKKLAAKNNISEFQFFEMLKSKDVKEADYRKDVKKKLAQEKLYRKIYIAKKISIKKKDLQNYYNANKNQFVRASSFSVATYQSAQRKSLEKIRQNPMLSVMGVKVKTQTLKSGTINPKLENLLNETKSGEFTPILNTGKELTMFYIKEKIGVKTLGFDKVKNYIYSLISSKKQKQAINDYFEKLKSVANVKVLRKPNT
jgi:parvulin-like peptidyl-prolyl isomerase